MRPGGQATRAPRHPTVAHTPHHLGRFRRAREPGSFIHGKGAPRHPMHSTANGTGARFSQAQPSSRLVEAGGG